MTDTQPASGVDKWAMQSAQMIPVPLATGYGEREHMTMQVRNAPNGSRATRQVATSGVHHFDVQAYPEALHINLYSDTSAGWLFLRRTVAEQLYEALGQALGKSEWRKTVSDAYDAIESEHPGDEYLIASLDQMRAMLGMPVVARIDTTAPKNDGSPDYSANHSGE